MDLGNRYAVKEVAVAEFQSRLHLPVPTFDGRWLVTTYDDSCVYVLDSQLRQTERVDLGIETGGYVRPSVSLSANGRWFAAATIARVKILDRSGRPHHSLPQPSWQAFEGSSCIFDRSNRLWFVRPHEDGSYETVLCVVNPDTGRVIAEHELTCDLGHHELTLCPDGQSVMGDVGCGQDGSYLYLARLQAGKLDVREYPFSDRTFVGNFSQDGSEFATGAHCGDKVAVHSFPSGDVIGEISSAEIFANDHLDVDDEDSVGYQALFLGNTRIVATTSLGRLLLINRPTMRCLGTVWPEGYELNRFEFDVAGPKLTTVRTSTYEGDITSIHDVGQGRLLVVYRERRLAVVDVSSLVA
jgi:hypothetical protein